MRRDFYNNEGGGEMNESRRKIAANAEEAKLN